MQNSLKDHLEEIKQVLCEDFGDHRSAPWMEPHNKLNHGFRTAALAETLRQNICPDDKSVDPYVLMVASWFHDIRNGRSDDHENEGADIIPALIGMYGSKEEIRAVCEIVRYHDHRTEDEKKEYSTAIKLVQDADLLDHHGTYRALSEIRFLGHAQCTVNDFTDPFENGLFEIWTSEDRKKLNFEYSMQIFDEKTEFERMFGQRMLRELRGEPC